MATKLLGTMIGGYNVSALIELLQHKNEKIADCASSSLSETLLVYDAINDVKDAMEGKLSPEMKEEITGNAEVREVYKISKVGTIAGCMVLNGKIFKNSSNK